MPSPPASVALVDFHNTTIQDGSAEAATAVQAFALEKGPALQVQGHRDATSLGPFSCVYHWTAPTQRPGCLCPYAALRARLP
jgi:hypothetical protein